MHQQLKKMSLIGLILMIFTSVFGFANSPSAFYLMGYSAMPFYLFSALFFFIPFALMMAEMGSAYRREEGGIYSWMNHSVGPRFAFIGTFMWFASYVVWMVSTAAKIWVPLSTFLFGADKTQTWALGSLTPTQTVGILAACWMVVVTFIAVKGINKIAKITAVGGIAVMGLNLVLLLVSGAILLLNGGHFAQPLNFTLSPNPGYQSGMAMLSFVVFAIFAYGGIEAVGGLVDKTDKPEKNFAKGIIIAAIVISIGYSLAIVLWGVSANWQQVLGAFDQPRQHHLCADDQPRGDAGPGPAPDPCGVSPDRGLVRPYYRPVDVSRLHRRVLHPQLFSPESDYPGHAKSALAVGDDPSQRQRNARHGDVAAVSAGRGVYRTGIVRWG